MAYKRVSHVKERGASPYIEGHHYVQGTFHTRAED